MAAAIAATVGVAAALPALGATACATPTAASPPTRGVTGHTVTVGGLVAGDAASRGADVGAQARFRRANQHGGVAGRTIEYRGTETDGGDPAKNTAAVQTLSADVFAVVPAVSGVLDTGGLERAAVPFFGRADNASWEGNRFGFGFAGAQAAMQTRVVSPAWGVQLRALLGDVRRASVAIATDDGALGAARAEQARLSLRAAGFRVLAPVMLPAPPAALPDVAPIARGLTAEPPAAVLLVTSSSTTSALAQHLTVLGYTGTVATTDAFYVPTAPALASGLTVLVPYAPFEQSTAANRRLVADVKAFAPDTPLTPGVAAGYWAADHFLRVLARVGRQLTLARFLAVANRGDFTYGVPGTVGTSTWPAMHSRPIPCGALVQSDGTRYFVVAPYRCDDSLVRKRPKPKNHGT